MVEVEIAESVTLGKIFAETLLEATTEDPADAVSIGMMVKAVLIDGFAVSTDVLIDGVAVSTDVLIIVWVVAVAGGEVLIIVLVCWVESGADVTNSDSVEEERVFCAGMGITQLIVPVWL
ncbi:hypothetical protein ACEPPN_000328 [Leptodophora sp. 'Broadleaf-Isolate-01']